MTGKAASGLATAVDLAGGFGAIGIGDQPVQDDMFEADAPLPMPPAKGTSGAKGGRPAGARNRTTEEWRRFLLGKYRSPLVFLLEAYSRTPAELAEQLQLYKFHEGKLVTQPIIDAAGRVMLDESGHELRQPVLATGDAAAIQVQAAIAALPYLHQKLPMALDIKSPERGVVVIGELTQTILHNLGGLPIADDEQNQKVIDGSSVRLSSERSDEQSNPLIFNED